MTTKLKKCPCGETPDFILFSGTLNPYLIVSGNCCDKWLIRTVLNNSASITEQGEKAWNETPRGET